MNKQHTSYSAISAHVYLDVIMNNKSPYAFTTVDNMLLIYFSE